MPAESFADLALSRSIPQRIAQHIVGLFAPEAAPAAGAGAEQLLEQPDTPGWEAAVAKPSLAVGLDVLKALTADHKVCCLVHQVLS